MSQISVLEREMYPEAEAARLLRVPQSTLHYWLKGGQRRGKTYRPVIRIEPTSSRAVTWAEFVEAGLLRSYRNARVPMTELRTFIDLLRADLAVTYPLAHHRPFVSGRNLVMQAQDQAGLDPDFCLVAVAGGQLILTGPSQLFVDRITWDGDIAACRRPHDDPSSPVRMSPDVRFGKPAIGGISTEILWEHDQAGEAVDEIARDFDLSPDDVRWAWPTRTRSGPPTPREHWTIPATRTTPARPPPVLRRRRHARPRQAPRSSPKRRHLPRRSRRRAAQAPARARPVVSPAVPDTEWIPVVTAHQWLIITRDSNIAVNRAEVAAIRANAARMVTLSGRDAIGTWNQLEILMTQWRRIQSLLNQAGPFIYAATRTSMRAVDLT